LVLPSLEPPAHAFRALESCWHAGESLPYCPVTGRGSSCAANGRAGEEYQVKARYQIRANTFLHRYKGADRDGYRCGCCEIWTSRSTASSMDDSSPLPPPASLDDSVPPPPPVFTAATVALPLPPPAVAPQPVSDPRCAPPLQAWRSSRRSSVGSLAPPCLGTQGQGKGNQGAPEEEGVYLSI